LIAHPGERELLKNPPRALEAFFRLPGILVRGVTYPRSKIPSHTDLRFLVEDRCNFKQLADRAFSLGRRGPPRSRRRNVNFRWVGGRVTGTLETVASSSTSRHRQGQRDEGAVRDTEGGQRAPPVEKRDPVEGQNDVCGRDGRPIRNQGAKAQN
jgi:hypothetical protein